MREKKRSPRSASLTQRATAPDPPPPAAPEIDQPLASPKKLTFASDVGPLVIHLDPTWSPIAAARMVRSAQSGFFHGIVVHRVVPGFVAQFGDPEGDGYGGSGKLLRCETSPVPFDPLDVGIALAGRDTGSSQLFVTLSRTPHLDGEYAHLGHAEGDWSALAEGDVIGDVTVEDDSPTAAKIPIKSPRHAPRHRRRQHEHRLRPLRRHGAQTPISRRERARTHRRRVRRRAPAALRDARRRRHRRSTPRSSRASCPSLTEPMVELVRRAFGREALVVGPGIRSGHGDPLREPARGRRRSHRRTPSPRSSKRRARVIVVDFGTATNFDCVTPKGEYLGGVLAPGIQISADALFARAAKLPRVEIAKPPKVVGRNTVHSMQSGIVYGYVGLVDGLVERILAELGFPCAVIATGGLASLIAPLSNTIDRSTTSLTLTGLRLLHERN